MEGTWCLHSWSFVVFTFILQTSSKENGDFLDDIYLAE